MIHVLLAIFAFLTYYVFSFYRDLKKYPKGPRPLPFIGNLHQYDWKRGHLYLTELSKKYGNIFTVYLPRPYVVICDYKNIKEAFSKSEDFAGRTGVFPDTVFQNIHNGGVIFSEVVRSLESCLEYIKSLNPGGPQGIDLLWPLQLFVGNVINETLYNFSYKPDNCQPMKEFVIGLQKQFTDLKDSKLFFIAQSWKWLEHIPFFGYKAVGRFHEIVAPLKEIVRRDTLKAKEGYDPSQEPDCFVHAYIQKAQGNPNLTEEQLLNVCMDFYLAGMETTTTTLRWAMLYMAKYPEVQDKLRAEIAREVGFSRLPTMNDKLRMPYFTATISEIQRVANIAPLNVNHRTVRDTSVGGESIPENTIVIELLSNVLTNSPVFSSKNSFNPDQFLMKDGTLNKEALEHNIPFSIGKRVCAGESLARVELFLGLSAIIQNFKIEPLPGKDVDLTPIFSTVLLPTPQNVRLVPLVH